MNRALAVLLVEMVCSVQLFTRRGRFECVELVRGICNVWWMLPQKWFSIFAEYVAKFTYAVVI